MNLKHVSILSLRDVMVISIALTMFNSAAIHANTGIENIAYNANRASVPFIPSAYEGLIADSNDVLGCN